MVNFFSFIPPQKKKKKKKILAPFLGDYLIICLFFFYYILSKFILSPSYFHDILLQNEPLLILKAYTFHLLLPR